MSEVFEFKSWSIPENYSLWDASRLPSVHRFLFSNGKEISESYPVISKDLLLEGVFDIPFSDVIFEYKWEEETGAEKEIDRLVIYAKRLNNRNLEFFPLVRYRDERGWTEHAHDKITVGIGIKGPLSWKLHPKDRDNDVEPAKILNLLICSTVLLSLNNFVGKRIIIPENLQRARARQHKCCLYDFTTVNLKPELFVRKPSIGSHASPMLHWRRGHYRKTASGKFVSVKSCLVGCPEYGFKDKEYDAGALS